jgi:hypothetical protein
VRALPPLLGAYTQKAIWMTNNRLYDPRQKAEVGWRGEASRNTLLVCFSPTVVGLSILVMFKLSVTVSVLVLLSLLTILVTFFTHTPPTAILIFLIKRIFPYCRESQVHALNNQFLRYSSCFRQNGLINTISLQGYATFDLAFAIFSCCQ